MANYRQRGFLGFGITGYIALGAIAVIGIASATAYVQTQRLASVKKEYATFQATVKAQGELAAKEADRINKENAGKKEKIDSENIKLRADRARLAGELRDARASSRYVPPAAPGSASPDIASFKRADLERTLQRLDAGVSGIVAEGDGAVTDLNSAKIWASQAK